MGFTNYLGNKLLDHAFRNVEYVRPATVYLALFTAAPSDAGGGTEVSGFGYARQAITLGAAAAKAQASTAVIEFGPDTGTNWGTISHVGIFDALTVGNLMAWVDNADLVIQVGDYYRVPIGSLTTGI